MIIRIDYDNDLIQIDEREITEDSQEFQLPIHTGNVHKFLVNLCNMISEESIKNHRNNRTVDISLEKQDEDQVTTIEDY